MIKPFIKNLIKQKSTWGFLVIMFIFVVVGLYSKLSGEEYGHQTLIAVMLLVIPLCFIFIIGSYISYKKRCKANNEIL